MRPISLIPLLIALALFGGYTAGHAALLATLSTSPDWSVDGEQLSAELGFALAGAGDVNGDGFDDVVVGAPKYELEVYREGAAFVFHGDAQNLGLSASWSAGGGVSGGRFGSAVASAGDVNNDGYDDLIVGAHRYNLNQPDEGAAFLFYGSPDGLEQTPAWSYISTQKDMQFGYAVAGAGDINGDGFDDVIVGARQYSLGQDLEGAVFVFYGSQNGLKAAPDWRYESDQVGANLGTAVAGAGDINGDGYADLIAGAPFFDEGEPDEGLAYIFYGMASGLPSMANAILQVNRQEAWFGAAVAGAGDVNADGYADVIVGAPHANDGQEGEGIAYVYLGSAAGLSQYASWMRAGNQISSWFGCSVASAGDVNDDGYDDIVIGAYGYETDQPDEGGAFVFLGGENGPDWNYAWRGEGDKIDTGYGFSTGTAGDVNQDGHADLLVGAPDYRRDDKTIMGKALLYLGMDGSTPTSNYTIHLPVLIAGN